MIRNALATITAISTLKVRTLRPHKKWIESSLNDNNILVCIVSLTSCWLGFGTCRVADVDACL